jgi:hypothetical protein
MMSLRLLILLCSFVIINGRHFNGGTITWASINPYDNSSSVGVTITQSYAWTYPLINCATNVPISTSGRSDSNLTCVADCSTDGGYSARPIDILTDCTSASSSLGMMNSQRSRNISLTAGAYFYLAFVGSAWAPLNDPAESGLEWSIVTFIDLRMRPDGFINTPPVASVVSPQYAIVNRTIQINIPVSDVNVGDDVRCRWSTYTPGYRRRKRADEDKYIYPQLSAHKYKKTREYDESIHLRRKRGGGSCPSGCSNGDNCNSHSCPSIPTCIGTCNQSPCCNGTVTATVVTTVPTTVLTTDSTTTIDTPGTLKSTSSYIHQQAIDECGGICYPSSVPNDTTLSNCTITFTGFVAGTWYAVALQVNKLLFIHH